MKYRVVVTITKVHRGTIEIANIDPMTGKPYKEHEIKSKIFRVVAGHDNMAWDTPEAVPLENIGLDVKRVDE